MSRVESKAVGLTVQTRVRHAGSTHKVGAGEQFVKICHDELVALMAHEGEPLTFAPRGATGIMMVGLQGSGKTTSSAKLARYLAKEGKRPLLVAADMQRPAAVEQLKVLGEQIEVPVFNLPGATPLEICMAAPAEAAKPRSRRHHLRHRRPARDRRSPDAGACRPSSAAVEPENILLVVDAMIGQDAVKVARGFNEPLGLSGVVLTKLDGDARGGAALSVKEVTGAPIVFVGMGETTDKLEPFRPEGMASRVLGMGDVVGLMKDFEEVVDQKKAEEDATRMMSGDFTLDDFLNQIRMIQKMGSLRDLMDKIPGMGAMLPPGAAEQIDDGELSRVESIIQSMTHGERNDAHALVREPSRVRRIARGSGQTEQAVSELVQKFLFMRQMMGGMGGDLGLLGNIPGLKNLAMARNLRRKMGSGQMPGLPPGMGFPGMGMPGMGMPGAGAEAPRMRVLSKSEKNARKNSRKRERDARKKNKGR